MSNLQNQTNLMLVALEIAHYTGWPKDEVFSWTADEIEMAINHIDTHKKEHWIKELMLVEYQILLTSEYNKKSGKTVVADTDAYRRAKKQADKIKEYLTGFKTEQAGGVESSGLAGAVRVTDMSVEEFIKIKPKNI
jgi:hypothetical protein